MGWSTLAKVAAWVALAAFVVWGIYFIVTSIKDHYYQQGVDDTVIQYEEREKKINLAAAKETSRIAEQAQRTRALLLGELQSGQAEIQKLNGDIIGLTVDGLWIAPDENWYPQCSDPAGNNSDTGICSSRPTGIRLPSSYEKGLSDVTRNAQLCVIQYHTLRGIVKTIPNVKIIPKPAP
jgi:hypothetical protein